MVINLQDWMFMGLLLLVGAASSLSDASLTFDVEDKIDDKVWLFAVTGRRKPYAFPNEAGKLVGFDVDLVEQVCKTANRKCQVVLAGFEECAFTSRDTNFPGRGLMSGWFDACAGYTNSIDRSSGGFDFTQPYLSTFSTFSVLPGNPTHFDPASDDYSNFTIAHLTGAVSNSKCLTRLGKKFGKIIIAKDLPNALSLLNNGTADALFSPRTAIQGLATLDAQFHCEDGGSGMMTKKGSELLAWWNKAFSQFASHGNYQTFCNNTSKKYNRQFKCQDPPATGSDSHMEKVNEKTYLFAVDGRRRPYNFFNDVGRLVGFDVDLIQEVCKIAGKKCAIILSEFTECTFTNRNVNFAGRGLMSSWFDACVGYVDSVDRLNAFDFSGAYLETSSTFTVQAGNPSGFNPLLTDYSNFTFVHLTGAVTNAACLQRLQLKVKDIIIANDLPEAKEILATGKADVLFSPRTRIPGLETFPQRLHCELSGISLMVKKGSSLPAWWDQAFNAFNRQGAFRHFCEQSETKYNRKFRCMYNASEFQSVTPMTTDRSATTTTTYKTTHKTTPKTTKTTKLPTSTTTKKPVLDKKTYLFAVSGRRKPFNFLDQSGRLSGFDVDFVHAVCKIADKKCAIVLSPFPECSFTERNIGYPGRGLMSGWFDACVGYVDSVDRENSFDFTDAYLRSYSTFSVLPSNPSGFDPNNSQFSNFTFVHLTGAYTNAACLNRLGKPPKAIVIADNLPDAQLKLTNRDADVLFSPRSRIPDLKTFPHRVHCELHGTSMMVKEGSQLPTWWDPAFESFVSTGGYKQFCADSIVKYDFPIKCNI